MNRAAKVALASAAISLAIGGSSVTAILSTHGWKPSALVHMRSAEPMARPALQADASFIFDDGHYDGVYFYTIARDPLARGKLHELIDKSVYRYGHPGYGWLAGILSTGYASAVPTALVIIGLAAMAAGGYGVSRVAAHAGYSPWAGLLVGLSPGLVFAVSVDTAEPLAVAVGAAGLLAWMRGRLFLAAPLFVAACLIKEPMMLLPLGLALWELMRIVRHEHAPGEKRFLRLWMLGLGPAALLIWYVALRARFGVWPFKETAGFLGAPLMGWIDTLRHGLAQSGTTDTQIIAISTPLVVVTGSALLIGAVRAVRLRTLFDAIFLPFMLLGFMQRWWSLFYPKDLVRELVYALLLLPAVLAGPRAAASRILAEDNAGE